MARRPPIPYVLYFDGSSFDKGRRGGPGPSAGAAVLFDEDGVLHRASCYLPASDTNTAEFCGLIQGLELALSLGAGEIRIHGDSRIVIDQVLRIKHSKKLGLIQLTETVHCLLQRFEKWDLTWIPRQKNTLADREARECIDRHQNQFRDIQE